MQAKDVFLGLFDRECAITRRMLERVPMDKPTWKPAEKSMELGLLVGLVATVPAWFQSMIQDAELDIAPKDGSKFTNTSFKDTAELLAGFEACVRRGRDAFVGTTDEHLLSHWRMLVAGSKVTDSPRHEVVADTFGHWAHHRGQLSVYLRLLDVPLASIYGPTADERGF
ncbi:MAG: DinB family protein [Vicinamibacteria bacterium]